MHVLNFAREKRKPLYIQRNAIPKLLDQVGTTNNLQDIQLINKYKIKIKTLLSETESENEIQLSKSMGYNVKHDNIFKKAWSKISAFLNLDFWSKIVISIICTIILVCITVIYYTIKQFSFQ